MAVDIDELAGPDGGDEGVRLAKFWNGQLEKVRDDSRHKRWLKRGSTIEKRYRDERNRSDEEGQRRYNSLWSNVEILTPAVYGRAPVAIAERRFHDKDPTGRGAAQILERALRNEMEICGFDEAIQQAVRDYLLPGQGIVWVRYEPEFEEGVSVVTEGNLDLHDAEGDIEPKDNDTDDEENEGVNGPDADQSQEGAEDEDTEAAEDHLRETGDRIVRESTPIDYIHWEDFITFPHNARTWKEVTAICKRVYMTRDQMKRRFGKEIAKAVPLKKDDRGVGRYDGPDVDPDDKGEIYEIWSLTTKEVFWVAEGYQYLCDRKDDPLKLENFFPIPKPLFANTTNGTLYPVADYMEYQDQATQIDELTQRISMLTKACKVAGVYNSAAKDIQRLLQESVENELIPVDDWAAFAEKGGVAGNISLLPLKEIIGVINELITVKEKTIAEMDRLTGITDIMRGTTDARETMGAQRIKTNSAGTRLTRRQNEVARFCRDTVRIMSDIMAQHFSDKSLIDVSGALYEEGLGDIDLPAAMDALNSPPGPTPLPGPQAMGGPAGAPPPQMPPGAPPVPPMAGGQPPGGMAQPPGSNVVPFPQQGQPPMGMPQQPQQPQMPPEIMAKMMGLKRIMDAIKLIRNERLRGFRVDIEVDSTIFGDAQQEKGDRTQFITAITGYLQQAMAMSAQVPEIAPLLGKFLQFGARGFRVGRDLESAIEDFCDEAVIIAKQKSQAAQQKPNPQEISAQASLIKAKASAQGVQTKADTDKAKLQLDAHKTMQKTQDDSAKDAAEIQRQQLQNQGEQGQAAAEERKAGMDMQMKEMEINLERMKMQFETMKLAHQAMQPMEEIAKGVEG